MSLTDYPKYIKLSLSPSDINSERYHGMLQKGLVIVGAVSNVEDHGYTICTGIKNVRAFLPMEKTKLKLSIGALVYGCIDEMTSTATTSTIILKTNKGNDIGMLEIGEHDPVLDLLLPGTVVPFTMTKILKNGLQGTIFDTFVSYVNENYLTEPLHRPNDYTIGLQFDSRILYVMPLMKHVALTMNFSKVKFEGDDNILPVGTIIENAVSLGQSGGVILFKIDKSSKGIITLKSIKSRYKGNYDERTALLAYGKTTKHRLRVQSYNAFERVFVCTDNEILLNETYFSVNDLSPGDIVEAKVGKVIKGKEKVITVKVGQVRGFIQSLDSTGSDFKKGMKIKARVLYVDLTDKSLLLTNRPEIVRAKNTLTSLEDARVGDVYTGLIVKDSPALFLVRFFNKIKGVVFKNHLETSQSSLKTGTVADFQIVDIQGERLVLKVVTDIHSSEHLGTIVSAKIECLYPTGAQIKVKKLNLTGSIPINYFSDVSVIAEALFNSMKEGQKIKVVNIMSQIFSVRDVDYYAQQPPLTIKDTHVGDVLKATVKSYEEGIVEILCPLKDFRTSIKLHINKILPQPLKTFDEFEITSNTPIYVRVESKLSKPKTLVVSGKLEDVWNGSSDASVFLMHQYFRELDVIKASCVAKKKQISKFHVGETVSGVITEKFESHDILVLSLSEGVSALCRNVMTKNFNVGDTVKGKIIWIDYVRQVVDMVVNPKAMSCISEDQSVKEDFLVDKSRCKGHVILVRDDVIVVSIGDKGPLIYLSPKFHTNDYQPTLITSLAQYGKTVVHLLKVVEGRVIGMFEDNFKQCQEFMKVYENKYGTVIRETLQRKRKHEEMEEEKNKQKDDTTISAMEINETETQIQPKKKKKKHLKAASTKDEAVVSTNEPDKKINKKKKPLKNKSQIGTDIESMFKNQLDGAVDLIKKSKKKHKKAIKPQNLSVKNMESKNLSKQMKNDSKIRHVEAKKTKKLLRKQGQKVINEVEEMRRTEHKNSKDKISNIEVKTVKNKKLFSVKIKQSKPIMVKSEAVYELPKVNGFWSEKPLCYQNLEDDINESNQIQNTQGEVKFTKNSEPKSMRDFDRLLQLTPDNSKLWIKYMQFYMKAFEIEKAKGVGQRAMKVINYRNEKDKLNVWMELIKIEINHGTNESFNTLFREAILRNQPLKVYSKTLSMLIESGKIPQVNGILGPMLKKYKPYAEMWLIAAETYYQIGSENTAKELLEKAYKSLPKDERMFFVVVKLYIKFKLKYFRYGFQRKICIVK